MHGTGRRCTKKHNELKEKDQNLEDRSQGVNPRIDGITVLGKILVRHRGIT